MEFLLLKQDLVRESLRHSHDTIMVLARTNFGPCASEQKEFLLHQKFTGSLFFICCEVTQFVKYAQW